MSPANLKACRNEAYKAWMSLALSLGLLRFLSLISSLYRSLRKPFRAKMLRPIFLFSLSAVSSTYAQFTLTSDGCVDASGFNSCMSQVTTQVQQCVQNNCQGGGTCEDFNNCQSSDANCYPACLCGGYQAWINCAASHCWNKVPSPCIYRCTWYSSLAS